MSKEKKMHQDLQNLKATDCKMHKQNSKNQVKNKKAVFHDNGIVLKIVSVAEQTVFVATEIDSENSVAVGLCAQLACS